MNLNPEDADLKDQPASEEDIKSIDDMLKNGELDKPYAAKLKNVFLTYAVQNYKTHEEMDHFKKRMQEWYEITV
jgi:hypothetical protein